jgi:ubiquinone/menaquinone biosynthesis C-methylase UbiE
MISEKTLQFLKKLFHNPREDWHKKNFKLFTHSQKILDVGCGRGMFLGLAPDRIVGVDHNCNFLKECVNKGYSVISSQVLNLPFTEQSFDGIYCADLIEHFSPLDLRCLLMEMSRVLRVGGLLVIATPLPSKMFWNDPTHVRPYPPHCLLSYCIRAEANYAFPYNLKFVKLQYRHTQLYQLPVDLYFDGDRMRLSKLIKPSSLFFMLSNLASRIKLNHPNPEGYVMVMQKI